MPSSVHAGQVLRGISQEAPFMPRRSEAKPRYNLSRST